MTLDIFIAHGLATAIMVGVIWVVQLVHYPLFSMVGEGHFTAYHAEHVRLITYIVGPAMLVELGGALYLCAYPLPSIPRWVFMVGIGLIGVAWITTALASVPMHNALAGGFEEDAHHWLVVTNWARTIAWSARGALVYWMIRTVMLAPPA